MNVRSKGPIRYWPLGMPENKRIEFLSAAQGAE